MGRFGIGFNNQGFFTTYPAVFSNVYAEDLDLLNQGPTGVLAILGEGYGMIPPKVATALPSGAPSRWLASSDLLVATSFAVRPFTQFQGAVPQQVYVVPVTPATPAALTLQGSGGVPAPVDIDLMDDGSALGTPIQMLSLHTPLGMNPPAISASVTSNVITVVPDPSTGLPNETYDVVGLGGNPSLIVDAINATSQCVTAILRNVFLNIVLADLPTTPFTPPSGPSIPAIVLTTVGWGPQFNAMTAQVITPAGGPVLTLTLPGATAASNIVEVYQNWPDLQTLVDTINDRSGLVTAVFATPPPPLGATLVALPATPFAGGSAPPATPQDWADAFTALAPIRANLVTVTSGDPTIWAMLQTYCSARRSRGFIGESVVQNWNGFTARAASMATLKASAALMNDPRIMHVGLGAEGSPGALAAARYAALAAIIQPSVPMTQKQLGFTALEARLDPWVEVGGVDGLLMFGVSPPVPDPDSPSTFLVSRGLSTWTGDANLYRCEQSVLAAVDGLQDTIEADLREFVGGEGTAITLRRIYARVLFILNQALDPTAAIRIASFDPNSIVVTFSSDTVVRVTCKVSPIAPINWVVVNLILTRTDITITSELDLAAA
jgi:hypothetical protein